VIEASARIVAAVSAEASSTAQPHSVCDDELCCTTAVDNSGVYVCYLKGIVSIYFRCPAGTEFLWNTPLPVYLQPIKLSNTQVWNSLPISIRKS